MTRHLIVKLVEDVSNMTLVAGRILTVPARTPTERQGTYVPHGEVRYNLEG